MVGFVIRLIKGKKKEKDVNAAGNGGLEGETSSVSTEIEVCGLSSYGGGDGGDGAVCIVENHEPKKKVKFVSFMVRECYVITILKIIHVLRADRR